MRSIWSGSIKFGTIFIPIRLYAASENLHIGFHLVHKTDCGRVHYKKVCEKDGKELEPHEIAKAIDIAGECIQFTDEEIKISTHSPPEPWKYWDSVNMKKYPRYPFPNPVTPKPTPKLRELIEKKAAGEE